MMEDMQAHIAHLQKTVEDLSDIVARQDEEISTLQRQIKLLLTREAEREVEAGGTVPLADQKPPHY